MIPTYLKPFPVGDRILARCPVKACRHAFWYKGEERCEWCAEGRVRPVVRAAEMKGYLTRAEVGGVPRFVYKEDK